jgi:hypothetical protein
MSLQINIMQGFRAIALHHLPIVCRSSGTSILEYIGKYFKFRIEKKTGDLGCFVCPLPVFFSLNYQLFLATLPIFLSHEVLRFLAIIPTIKQHLENFRMLLFYIVDNNDVTIILLQIYDLRH